MARRQNNQSWMWLLITGGMLAELLGCLSEPALAQITPDETLGGERSAVTRDVQVRGRRGDRIDGGARRGANLFHSFQEFNVNDGQRVYFGNPSGVENILGRITGADVSDILGTLGVDGGANLFLLNPNGIVFGPNAQLDVSGSFIATTANRFTFANGGEFSAINPQVPSLLTVSAPIGVQFGGTPGGITVEGTGLSSGTSGLLTRRSLALMGGDVLLNGASLVSAGGQIELGAAREGTVNFNQSGNLFRLSFPETTERANISIENDSAIGLLFGGSIAVTGQNLNISESGLLASTLGASDVAAGDITLDINGIININQNSIVANVPAEQGGGNIRIETGSLSVTDQSSLSTTTFGLATDDAGNPVQSNAGDIIINARDAVLFSNGSASTEVVSGARGNGGNIQITASELAVIDGAVLNASTNGIGDAGDVLINARDQVLLSDTISDQACPGVICSITRGTGSGGNIDITTGSLSVINGAALRADTRGSGDAGSINIDARNSIEFNNGSALAEVEAGANGNAGDIEIATGTLTITNNGLLAASTAAQGDAGNIIINARGDVVLDGGRVSSSILERGRGDGGNVEINAQSLFLRNSYNNPSNIFTNVDGRGNGGSVIINARDAVSIDGSVIYDIVNANGVGNSGNIEITTGSLSLNQSQLQTQTGGQGDAGSVIINARDTVSFNDSAVFSTVANDSARGNGGNVEIITGSLSLNRTQLLTATNGQGDAGSVIINARDTVSFNDSAVFSTVANGARGNGGNVEITTGSLSLNRTQLLTATNGQGDAGSVIINARDTVSFNDSAVFSTVANGARGNGGNVEITTGSLSLNRTQLLAQTGGQGDAGSVVIDVADSASLDSSSIFSSVFSTAKGDGGNIEIDANSLTFTNSMLFDPAPGLIASTDGQGNSGSIIINVRDSVSINRNNFFSGVGPNGVGSGGRIDITTGSLSVNSAGLITGVEGGGNGSSGNVIINARDSVTLSRGGAYSNVAQGGVGNGGIIQITTDSLSVTDGWQLFSSTEGQGNAGNVVINARDRVLVDGIGQADRRSSSIYSSAERNASGRGGTVTITTPELFVANGGVINARTENAQPGGNIVINTDSFEARNGGQVVTTTSNRGQAGNITLNATGSVTLAGVDPNYTEERQRQLQRIDTQGAESGLYSNATQSSTGQGGSINVTTGQLNIREQAQIVASSQGTGQAGNLTVNANSVALNDRANLAAETVSSSGGNIDLQIADSLRLDNSSQISASTQTGQGGRLTLNRDRTPTNSVQLAGDSTLSAQATGTGNAGNVSLNTRELAIQDQSSISAATTSGQGGNITLSGLNRLRVNGGDISAATTSGRAGGVTINAADSIELDGAEASLSVRAEGGIAGNLTVNTGQFTIQNGARATVSSTGSGRAGNLNITAQNVDLDDRASITAETESGSGGNVELQVTDSLQLRDNSKISASTQDGQGGSINLNRGQNSAQTVEIGSGSNISTQASRTGDAGSINFNTAELGIRGDSSLSATTTSGQGGDITLRGLEILQVNDSEISASTATGRAGSLTVNATETIDLRNNGRLAVAATAGGDAGSLALQTDQLSLRGSSEATVSSTDSGTAGDFTVRASEISLNRSNLTANTEAGSGGDINLRDVENLTLRNSSTIAATTQDGRGGRVRLNANQSSAERVHLNSGSRITTTATGNGAAGSINLNTEELVVQGSSSQNTQDNAQRTNQNRLRSRNSAITATSRSNQGGSIRINADRITVQDDGRIAASTRTGRAGNLTLEAEDSVRLDDRGRLTVAARDARGRAGNLTINTRELSLEDSSTIAASNISDRPVNPRLIGGNITLHGLETLEVEDSRISASTEDGQAGSLIVNADDSISLDNGRLLVQATARGGRAGGLSLTTDRFTASNSQVSVSSNRGRAGNLAVDASLIFLNDGDLTAQAGRGSGAEVSLENLDLLFLQNGSGISARATRQANGGNLTIDAADGFVVAPLGGDSDIIANAAEGRGGNIQITTQGIFGITEGPATSGNGTNDIDASSQAGIQGSVTINRPDTDPSRGLTELPADIVDASNQINRVCPTGSTAPKEPSEFVITGRGGLPSNPESALNGESLLADWVTLNDQDPPVAAPEPVSKSSAEAPLIEAQGWRIGPTGEVIFTAQASTSTSTSSLPSTHCR